ASLSGASTRQKTWPVSSLNQYLWYLTPCWSWMARSCWCAPATASAVSPSTLRCTSIYSGMTASIARDALPVMRALPRHVKSHSRRRPRYRFGESGRAPVRLRCCPPRLLYVRCSKFTSRGRLYGSDLPAFPCARPLAVVRTRTDPAVSDRLRFRFDACHRLATGGDGGSLRAASRPHRDRPVPGGIHLAFSVAHALERAAH